MFAESAKKGKSEKRGRFNAGEKDVLALAIEAKLTTVTGQVLFNEDGTRTEGTETRKVGSEFVAKFQLTVQEYEHICQQANMLLPPKGITTLFNGSPIQYRKPCGNFTETLPIPLADKEGVVRNTERKATVYLYEKNSDEIATIFEMGIPIVELGDDKWHVNVMQKVPLSRDRDNVNPSYLRRVRTGVLNAKFEELTESEEAGAAWVRDAMASPKSSDTAVKHVMETRFGKNYVTRDVNDKGSANEAVSQGYHLVEGGSMSKEEWDRIKALKDDAGNKVLKSSAEVAPTDGGGMLDRAKLIPAKDWTPAMHRYSTLVETISPKLIGKPVVVRYIKDADSRIEGCFVTGSFDNAYRGNKSKKGFTREFGVMTVNLAYVNPASAFEGYSLLLHELAHDVVRCNDHLDHKFYDTVNELGAKLAVLVQEKPELFDTVANSFYFTDVQPVCGAPAAS
jgi:hypothetical protein